MVYLFLSVVLLTVWTTLVEPYPYNPVFLKRFYVSFAILVVMLTYFEDLRELSDRALFKHIDEIETAQQSLRQSEEKFRKVFQNSPDSMAMAELDTAKFVDVNEAFERTFGFARDEILGRPVPEIGIWLNPEERTPWVGKNHQGWGWPRPRSQIPDQEWPGQGRHALHQPVFLPIRRLHDYGYQRCFGH